MKQLASRGFEQKRFVESLGRSVTGTGMIALGYMLAKEGLLTGNSPSSEKEREMWQLEGKMPNSIFLGGKWRKMDRVSPIGNLITIGSNINKLSQEKTPI